MAVTFFDSPAVVVVILTIVVLCFCYRVPN